MEPRSISGRVVNGDILSKFFNSVSVIIRCSTGLGSYKYSCTVFGAISRGVRSMCGFTNSDSNHPVKGLEVYATAVDAKLASHHRAVLPLHG